MSTAYDRLIESNDGRRALCVEQTITNVTELLCRHLDNSGMKRSELAKQMGVTPGRVTQLLDGDANLTLKSIAKALAAFGHVLSGISEPIVRMEIETPWTPRHERAERASHTAQAERPLSVFLTRFASMFRA